MSTARLAHLQAVPGEGIRVGDPNGPHVLLTPQAVRVHRVKDDAAGTVRQEDVPLATFLANRFGRVYAGERLDEASEPAVKKIQLDAVA